jgi:divalent metal cation (Fe/Co/Zn/Cd) transporter
MISTSKDSTERAWQAALWLAVFTILYNLAEGLVSVFFGLSDEALTLFGFGVDSFIEVMSGIGILAMVLRIRQNPATERSQFERTALRVTGTSFYLLAVGLAVTAIYNIISGHKPETTLPGMIISVISIAIMWALVAAKRKVGQALHSAPILADANCTLVCIYM